MLYLHCGWPRTSTTSLQAALFEHRRELAAAGTVYPEKWISHESPTHHGLFELLQASQHSTAPLDEFKAFLELHADRSVLFSAEAITSWLLVAERKRSLLDLLAIAREVMPTRCIWTLRRLDDGLQSLYLRRLAYAFKLQHPDRHFANIGDQSQLFATLIEVGEGATDVVHVKYDSSGSHNDELLRAFDIPAGLRAAIGEQLAGGERLNASLTHKQAVVLRELDTLSRRAGVGLDWVALRDAFIDGDLDFEDDRRCVLLGTEARRNLHERTLAAARKQGFAPYVEFFAGAEIPESSPVSLDPDVISDDDLERIVSHLHAAAPA